MGQPAALMVGGGLIATVGFVVLTQARRAGLAVLVGGSIIVAIGAGLISTTANATIGSAPPERAGSAAAISQSSIDLAGSLGIAALGSPGVVIYRATIAQAIPPTLRPDMAALAQGTIGSAVAIADLLPRATGAALLAAARNAFADAFSAIALMAAVQTIAATALLAVAAKGPRLSLAAVQPGPLQRPTARDIGQLEQALRSLLARVLQRPGLSYAEWTILVMLGPEPLTRTALIEQQRESRRARQGEVEATVDGLLAKGFLVEASEATAAGSGDIRGAPPILQLSSAGQTVYRPLQSEVSRVNEVLWGGLPAEDLAATKRTLAEVTGRAKALLAGASTSSRASEA
ncbi:MAG TPA: hypothetical protein VKI99_19610 [Candidatus Dormibacteraeota bacterium]|nr:hypothetical protein [Candidatus Dormibacteraeota bacterium]